MTSVLSEIWHPQNRKLALTLVCVTSFLVAFAVALAALALMHVYRLAVPRPHLAALFLAHALLPLYLRRGSEKARIALGSLFLLEATLLFAAFVSAISVFWDSQNANMSSLAEFTLGFAWTMCGLAYCSYLLFFSDPLRSEIRSRLASHPPRANTPRYAAPRFWIWLLLLYYFSRWLTNWYIVSILADPRWLAGRVSSAENDLMGAIGFVIAGVAPLIWLALRRFEYRRSFGPLLLWTVLIPIVILTDYLTSAASPFR